MKLRRRAPLALWLAAISLGLFAIPQSSSQSVRLTFLTCFQPLRSTALAARNAMRKAITSVQNSSTDELEEKLAFSQSELQRLHAENSELRERLKSLQGTRQAITRQEYDLLDADLIAIDTSNSRRSIVVHAGSRDGVIEGLPVVWYNSLIGRVDSVGPHTSRVILTTDPSFVARAISVAQRSMDGNPLSSRDIGHVQGDTKSIRMGWLLSDRPMEVGTQIVTTSDPDHYLKKGLLLGRVNSVFRGGGAEMQIEVEPAINVGALEFVWILVPQS